MLTCLSCSSQQSDTHRFCAVCGAPLQGKLVFVALIKLGEKYQQDGKNWNSIEQFYRRVGGDAYNRGLIVVCCYEADLKNGNEFIPHEIWWFTAHGPILNEANFKITIA